MCILNKRSIETIYKLCRTVSKLYHDFPPQLLENIIYFLREIMSTAEDTGDYYSFYYITESTKLLKMNQRFIKTKQIAILNKAENFAEQLSRLLNFQIPESEINVMLDELVNNAVKRDYRGPGVDILFWLKSRRDSIVNDLLTKKMDGVKIELELMQKDPFFMLNYDADFAQKTKDVQNYLNRYFDYIGIHVSQVPYELVSSLTKTELLSVIADVSRLSSVNLVEIPVNKMNRCKFLLAAIDTPEYEEHKNDNLLKICRAVLLYRYKKPIVELDHRKVYLKVKTILDEDEKKTDNEGLSGVSSKVLNSRS